MISGNHDGASRLGYGGWAAAAGGLHIVSSAAQIGTPVQIPDEHGPVYFYGIPFLDPKIDRGHLGDDGLLTHELILDAAMDRVRADLARRSGERSIVLAHCFAVRGERGADLPATSELAAEITESMRSIACGGVECAPTAVFEGVSYVALGHLHVMADGSQPGLGLRVSFALIGAAATFVLVVLPGFLLYRALFTASPSLAFEPGEAAFATAADNHSLDGEKRGGKLVLTERRIRFVPHRFNVNLDTVSVPWEDVEGVATGDSVAASASFSTP